MKTIALETGAEYAGRLRFWAGKKAAASSLTVKKDKGIVGIGKMNKDINKKVAFKIFYNSTEVKPFPK